MRLVRLYDGMDNQWTDVTGAVSQAEADRVLNELTANGTKMTSFEDITIGFSPPTRKCCIVRAGANDSAVGKVDLSREDMMEAITEGVRQAFDYALRNLEFNHGFEDVVREGVADGIMQIAKNGTDMPGADFFEMIKQGMAAGVAGLAK